MFKTRKALAAKEQELAEREQALEQQEKAVWKEVGLIQNQLSLLARARTGAMNTRFQATCPGCGDDRYYFLPKGTAASGTYPAPFCMNCGYTKPLGVQLSAEAPWKLNEPVIRTIQLTYTPMDHYQLWANRDRSLVSGYPD